MHKLVSQSPNDNPPLLPTSMPLNVNKGKRSTNMDVKYIDIDFTTHVLFLDTHHLLQIKEVYNEASLRAHDHFASESIQAEAPETLALVPVQASISAQPDHAIMFEQQYPITLPKNFQGDKLMSNVTEAMNAIMAIDGAIGVAIVDWNSGLTLGTQGTGLNLELAAAGNTNVVRAKQKVMRELGLKDSIEDILITLSTQYHMIRPLQSNANLFIYVVMNRAQANLGMARYQLQSIEHDLTV